MESSKMQGGVVARGVHILHTDSSGRLVHEYDVPAAIRYAYGTSVTTTVQDMEDYFRKKIREFGGDADSYRYLNVDRPKPAAAGPSDKEASKDLAELYVRAARLLDTPLATLVEKYQHLNNGLQAMNLRNRLRSKGHNV
jgi:hypothetical protein